MDLFPRIRAMGDAAVLVELGETLEATINARAHALARGVEHARGVKAVVPGYTTLLIEYDPAVVEWNEIETIVQNAVEKNIDESVATDSRVIEIPTRYGGAFGPDLEFVAQHNGITPADVIRIHTRELYQVFMLGFVPGFPYLGILSEQIAAPRLETPRARVPAGSVGIAGRQTGIYPRESPGGWRLIGRTEIPLFDPLQDPPTLLRAGDRVRFMEL